MSHNTRRTQKNRPAPIRAMRNHVGRVVGYVFRTPVLLGSLFLFAAIMQGALMLTLDRVPADSLAPATVTTTSHDNGCTMLCIGTPAAHAPESTHRAPAASAAPPRSVCWMFCSPPASEALPAVGVPWRMDL